MFRNSLALIDDCDIVHPHIFPYSPREGTPAARMPQIEPELRKRRAALLRDAGSTRRTAWLQSLVGTVQPVLVERPGDRGHVPAFAEVRWNPPGDIGAVQPILITGASATSLTGTPA